MRIGSSNSISPAALAANVSTGENAPFAIAIEKKANKVVEETAMALIASTTGVGTRVDTKG